MIYRAAELLIAVALVVAVALVLVSAFPSIAGADHSFIVQSSSMEPSIPTGSMILVKAVPATEIQEGDVITYADERGVAPTTHRVIEKHMAQQSVRFTTKGDANEDPDPEPVYRSEIIGVVTFTAPLIGYIVAFSKTTYGWLVLVVLPVLLLIALEVRDLVLLYRRDKA